MGKLNLVNEVLYGVQEKVYTLAIKKLRLILILSKRQITTEEIVQSDH